MISHVQNPKIMESPPERMDFVPENPQPLSQDENIEVDVRVTASKAAIEEVSQGIFKPKDWNRLHS